MAKIVKVEVSIPDLETSTEILIDWDQFVPDKTIKEQCFGYYKETYIAVKLQPWMLDELKKPDISVIGIGKLGLCFSLTLEKAGYSVVGVDLNEDYVKSINTKSLKSDEPGVEDLLISSSNLRATTDVEEALKNDIIFVLVATPSLPNGEYDHSQVDRAVDSLLKFGKQEKTKELVICCTTMPGYCDTLQDRVKDFNYKVSYNPEFIAQGTILRDQKRPDLVLIGCSDEESFSKIRSIYIDIIETSSTYVRMTRKEAEICKIALNCFLTTKISYANMVGDVAIAAGCDPGVILKAIGSDSRIGHKYLKYGYGFGGPCFPRDNRAFSIFADSVGVDAMISKTTDRYNRYHLEQQAKQFPNEKEGARIVFESVTYKPESTILEESQQLALAILLQEKGFEIEIIERPSIIEKLKEKYGSKFIYTERDR